MTSGIVKAVTFIYWGSAETKSWKNARTDEILREITYIDDEIRLPLRQDIKFIVANCNRHTEEYMAHRETVERWRPKKVRLCPLIVVELWKPADEGKLEEFWSIDSDYWMKEYLKRLKRYLKTPYK